MKKKIFQLIIGGEFTAQPKHKSKIIPINLLDHFYNTNPNDLGSIIDFANKYSFGGYIVPNRNCSIKDRFLNLQDKYNPIIRHLVDTKTINYHDLTIINKDLKSSFPYIRLRNTVNNLEKIKRGFAFYDLKNVHGEKPEYKITNIGAFEVDKDKSAHIEITIKVPAESKTKWYVEQIDDGASMLEKIFPDQDWGANKEYLKNIILKNGNIKFDSNKQVKSIEMNFYLGKTNFFKEELVAVWTSQNAESFLAKRIWDYVNSEFINKGERKLCKICAKIHTGRSKDYCSREACRKEWDSRRKKRKKK